VVWLGIVWQKNEREITGRLRSSLPGGLRNLIENID